MGDRGNIIVKERGSTVYLYTHWTGSELPEVIHEALSLEERWGDGPYLARILFQTMIDDDAGTAGFGISSVKGDGGTDIVVDVDSQTVDGVPFQKYLENRYTGET